MIDTQGGSGMKKVVTRTLTGVTTNEVRSYETKHREVARRAAADGMVLLKNEGKVLPVSKDKPVALYGAGAVKTIKGGTGSGDVNSRETVSVWQGMKNAGYQITTEKWLSAYEKEYEEKRLAWKNEIWRKVDESGKGVEGDNGLNFFGIYASTTFVIPAGQAPEEKEKEDTAKTAIVVLSRTAGEGSDRHNVPGDFQITSDELALLQAVCRLYEHVILVLNTGGLIDLWFTQREDLSHIDGILYMHQAGMEAGNAFADVLSGAVTPSAKLTDSWAYSYEDYPNAKTFSYNKGNVEHEEYVEGIYVGYRYFDTFDKPVRYGFGYGLSYTSFGIEQVGISHYDLGTQNPSIGVKVRVTNTGSCSGREVVQVYVSCPQDKEEKEFRRLAGYQKTKLLAPKETQELEIVFPLYQLASYDESLPGWVMEEGRYILMVGDSLQNTQTAGVVIACQDLVFARTEHICTPKEKVHELKQDETTAASVKARREALLQDIATYNKPAISLHEGDVKEEPIVYDGAYDNTPKEVRDFVDTLSEEQLILLATGDVAKGQGAAAKKEGNKDSQLGSAGTAVPGSAAQTSDCAAMQGLSDIVLADGPAGLRLTKEYQAVNGTPVQAPFLAALEGGYLLRDEDKGKKEGETYYQYCTAIPTGTELAQSWDPEMIKEVGKAVGEELVEFGVTLWLAPGMCIHRNPLCGRNFEYYSEDPLISGLCAVAMTEGVQSVKGVGTTIKHFACNNQEDNRMGSNSILSERTLREIYIKGFEICVRKAQPMSIMTSYNLVNGIHAANNYDLCTKAARCEWGFKGVIMTDWTTTQNGPDCTASGCLRAGNDLIMPGADSDHENIRKELEAGTLSMADLKRSVARLVNIVWQSNYTEEA